MAWIRVAAEVASWSAWFWQNRHEFAGALKGATGLSDLAQAAIANPGGAVRRAGNTILFRRPDGGDQVLAFVEEAAPRVEHIERAMDGLEIGQAEISLSLASLQTVSLVTLGMSALTPIVLTAQFAALNRKLSALERLVAGLNRKFDAAVVADLRTGLTLLRQGQDLLAAGEEPSARSCLEAALPACMRTMKYVAVLLGHELDQRKPVQAAVRLLARNLAVAAVGVASCQISLNQDGHAFGQSATELDLLRRAARQVFQESIGPDPAEYMLPALRESGVTIEFMTRLFQQARDAGAADAVDDGSVAAWFEQHRAGIFHARPRSWWRKWNAAVMRSRLAEAVAAVEETNRVLGLARLVEELRARGRRARDVFDKAATETSDTDATAGTFLAWSLD